MTIFMLVLVELCVRVNTKNELVSGRQRRFTGNFPIILLLVTLAVNAVLRVLTLRMLISTTPLLFSLPVLFSSSYVCFFVHFPSMILFRHFCFRSKSETIMLSRNFFHFETPDILVLFSVSGIWCI